MHDLLDKQVLGKYQAHVDVIEFQKRGAQNCHILILIDNVDNTSQNINNVIVFLYSLLFEYKHKCHPSVP